MEFFKGGTTEEIILELDDYKQKILNAKNDENSRYNTNNLKKTGFLREFGIMKNRLDVVQRLESTPSGLTPYWCRKYCSSHNWIGKNFQYSLDSKDLVEALKESLQSLPGCRIGVSSKGYPSIGQVITVFIQEISFPMFLSKDAEKYLPFAERFLGEENELPFSPYYRGLLTSRGYNLLEQINNLVRSYNYEAKAIEKEENYKLNSTLFHYTITIGTQRGSNPATVEPLKETVETLREFNWIVAKEGDDWLVKTEQKFSVKETMAMLGDIRNLGVASYESSSKSFVFKKDPRAELSRAKYVIADSSRSFIGMEEDQLECDFSFCSTLQELSNQFFQRVLTIVGPALGDDTDVVILDKDQNSKLTDAVGEYLVLSQLYHTREIINDKAPRGFDECFYNSLEFVNKTLSNFNLRNLSTFNLSSDNAKLALIVFIKNVFPGTLVEFRDDSSKRVSSDWQPFNINIMSSPHSVIANEGVESGTNLVQALSEIITSGQVLNTSGIQFTEYGFKLVKSLAMLMMSFISLRLGCPYLSALAGISINYGTHELEFLKTSAYDYSNITFGDNHKAIPNYEEMFEMTKKTVWDDSHHSSSSSEVIVKGADGITYSIIADGRDINKNVWIVRPLVEDNFTGYEALRDRFQGYYCTGYNEAVHGFIFTKNPAEFLTTDRSAILKSNAVEFKLEEKEPIDLEALRVTQSLMNGTRFKSITDYSSGAPLQLSTEPDLDAKTIDEIMENTEFDLDTMGANLDDVDFNFTDVDESEPLSLGDVDETSEFTLGDSTNLNESASNDFDELDDEDTISFEEYSRQLLEDDDLNSFDFSSFSDDSLVETGVNSAELSDVDQTSDLSLADLESLQNDYKP